MANCKECIHYGICWKLEELSLDVNADQKCCDESSLYVKLPCKVGDTVFKVFNGKIFEMRAAAIPLLISTSGTHMSVTATNYRAAALSLELSDFGKTVFLTRKEAEAALAAASDD